MYELTKIRLAEAHPSPTNPRKFYDEEKLKELATTIRERGIVHPLLVRPQEKGFEVVCGERRRRAAHLVGLKEIPVSIGKLTDIEVIELQNIENVQREDVHPLEEADGYIALQKAGRSVAEIAAKIGKSQSHVYGRLRLSTLGPAAREAFVKGEITPAVAQIVATIHNPAAQDRAVARLIEDAELNGEIDLQDAKDLIRREFMLVLADAPFDRADANLYGAAGACTNCPKRTGAQAQLFEDEDKKSDKCLDVDCYMAKADALWQQTAAKAEKGGGKILGDAETKKVFAYGNGSVAYGSKYVRLGEICYEDEQHRTYKKLLGERAKAETVLARDPQGGIHELVSKEAAIAMLKTTNKSAATELGRREREHTKQKDQQREFERKQKRARAITTAVITEVIRAVTVRETRLPDEMWFAITSCALRNSHSDTHTYVTKRRELEGKGSAARYDGVLRKHAASLPVTKLPALLVEMIMSQGAYYSHNEQLSENVAELAKACGVDVAKVRKAYDAEQKSKTKPVPAKKQKAVKRGR